MRASDCKRVDNYSFDIGAAGPTRTRLSRNATPSCETKKGFTTNLPQLCAAFSFGSQSHQVCVGPQAESRTKHQCSARHSMHAHFAGERLGNFKLLIGSQQRPRYTLARGVVLWTIGKECVNFRARLNSFPTQSRSTTRSAIAHRWTSTSKRCAGNDSNKSLMSLPK